MVAESARCGAAKATERLQVRTTDICSEATTRTGTPGHVHNIRGFLAPLSKACLLGAPAVATTDATLHAKVLDKVFLSVTREVHESGVAFELGGLRNTTDFALFVAFKLGATDLTLEHFVQSTPAVHAKTRVCVAWKLSDAPRQTDSS